MSGVDFYFDFSSPFAYLGSEQIEAVAERAGAQLTWKPMFLGGVFKAVGTPMVPLFELSKQKQQYLAKDIQRWADWHEARFQWPSRFPMNTIAALRLTLASGNDPGLIHAIFRAYWADDTDINDPSVLRGCLEFAGLDASLLERTADPVVKEELKTATSDAVEAGVFGAPTCVVGEQLFWGQDRLGFVERALSGWNPTAS